MNQRNRCLYCYQPVEGSRDFHEKCSLEFFGSPDPPVLGYTLDQMDELAKNIVERSITIPGVQPKLSLSLVNKTKENSDARLTVIGALQGHYVLKPPSEKFSEMPENEHVTMRVAEAFGITVVPSSLIRLQSGHLSYITKRIDRTEEGEKIHMIDMFQITEAFDKYKGSVEKVGKTLMSYSANTLLDAVFYFDLVLFSFLFGNNDMHLKNFSMTEGSSGWVLSPAYDLLNVAIILPEDTEELALTLAGKKRKLRREHFDQLATELKMTTRQTKAAFNRMVNNRASAYDWIGQSFLTQEMQAAYIDILESRLAQLGLA